MNIQEIILEKQGTIVDVRTREEFMGGHAENSINIPLHEIDNRIEELKNMPKPLVLCCASGGRSGQATQYLTSQKLECINAGSWLDVNYIQSLALNK